MTTTFSTHTFSYAGYNFAVQNMRRYAHHPVSMHVSLLMDGKESRSVSGGKNMPLKDKIERLISEHKKDIIRRKRSLEIEALSDYEKIESDFFAYARFQNNSAGNYYNIYWRDNESPTGVNLVGGCSESEWESISVKCGKAHCYYSPTECKQSAR